MIETIYAAFLIASIGLAAGAILILIRNLTR